MSHKTRGICIPILLAAIAFTAGCVSSSNEPPVKPLRTDGFSTYTSADYGISIDYPSTWSVNDKSGVVAVDFRSPLESSEDKFYDSVNVVINDLSGQGIDMDGYTEIVLEQLGAAYPDARITEADDVTLAGNPGRRIVFNFQGQQGKLESMQAWAIKDETAYVVSYTAEESSFDTYRPAAEQMMQSFQISTQAQPAPQPEPQQNQITSPDNGNVIGRWRAYSEVLYYDSGSAIYLNTSSTRILELSANGRWTFGSSGGTWSVQDITDADWTKWETGAYGPTKKIVLNGWNNGAGDGPIEGTDDYVDFMWIIYRAEPPVVSKPGQVQIKFGHAAG